MGEVYRAKDTRLHRIVAIKILPEHLSNNQKFRERFEREARAISALSHPNVCILHDIGHEDGLDFLVMEYLEGETLAERLKKGPLPLSQVLRHAIEIAGALAQAHRHGVIHRDLKPANIKLTKTGAKVLDFGLARIQATELAADATRTTETVTQEGAILGTLHYMAPEQLEGREADTRSDIFAFGVVVHEMATGKNAFEGKSRASVMAAILEREPPTLTTLNSFTPVLLDRVVKKCLAKEPDGRWQTAADLSTALEWAAENTAAPAVAIARATPRERFAWFSAAVLLVAVVVLVLAKFSGRESPPPMRAVRFSVPPPEKATLIPASPAVSPDGTLVAFLAATDGRPLVWIRPIDSQVSRPLAGTEDASTVFWSPDSHFLAFIAGGKLKKMEISSGSVSTVCDASSNTPGAWNPEGTIVLTRADYQPLHRVQAVGGVPAPLSTFDPARGDYRHVWPQWLPDSRHFLYFIQTNRSETTGVYASATGSPDANLIVASSAAGVYVPSRKGPGGHLLFRRGETLLAQSFDASTLKLVGEPVRIADRVGGVLSDYAGDPGFSVSQDVLAYHSLIGPRSQLVWLDRAGTRLGTLTTSDVWSHPSLSADGSHAAFELPDPRTLRGDLWITDTKRGITSRFNYDPANDGAPVWSPHGDRIAFNSVREGSRNLYWKFTNGGREELLLKSAHSKVPSDWSPDGKFILFYQDVEQQNSWDLWVLPLSGNRNPFPVVQGPLHATHGQFSPDGRWIVYASDESGMREIYAQPFSGSQLASTEIRGRKQISNGGGSQPRWRMDGRELFYMTQDSRIMAVAVKTGVEFETGKPQPLFQVRGVRSFDDNLYEYDVTPDGRRFLFNLSQEGTVSPITVVVNWDAAVK
jgi:serine/threonine protein kinase